MSERVRYLNLGPWVYFVGFTTDEAEVDREARRLRMPGPIETVPGAAATTHIFTREGHPGTAIIRIVPPSRRQSREQYAAMLAHEAVHVVQDMRAMLGDLGKEAEAYLVQFIVQSCLQIAWKTGRVQRLRPAP